MTSHLNALAITEIHVLDQDEALAFYCDTLGFEVRDDVDLGFMRWLTVALPGQEGPQLLLSVPGAPVHDPETAATLRDLLTKGALNTVFFESEDVRATYATLVGAGVEVTQEPVEQPYGTDMAIRDPFGTHIRITQRNRASNDEIQQAYAEMS